MANLRNNFRRNCELMSENDIMSGISDCSDSSDSLILPLDDVKPVNCFPTSRPPNFTKSQILRHFGVREKKEIVASTPVHKIRKRKSTESSQSSISLSPIQKQNSVQACNIVSIKKPDYQGHLQCAKHSDDCDDGLPWENEKATTPAQDVEVITKKKRISLKGNIKNEQESSTIKEKQQFEEIREGSTKNLKEVSGLLVPVVKLIKLPSNINKSTVNKSIQLSCKKKRIKKSEQDVTNKLENKVESCYDLINNEALAREDDKSLKEPNKCLEINKEVPQKNGKISKETKTKKQNKPNRNINLTVNEMDCNNIIVETDSLQSLIDKVDKDVQKYLGDNNDNGMDAFPENYDTFNSMKKRSENLTTKKESDKTSFFGQIFGSVPQDNLLQPSKKSNENSNRNEENVLDSPTSGKDQINRTREHNTSNLNTKKEPDKRSFFGQIFGNEIPQNNLLNALKKKNSSRNENIILSDIDSPTSDNDQINKTREHHISNLSTKKDLDKRNIFGKNFGSEIPHDHLLDRHESIVLSDIDSPTSDKDQINKTKHHTSSVNTKNKTNKKSMFGQNFGSGDPHDNLLNNLHKTNDNSNTNENIILSDTNSARSDKDQINKTKHHTSNSNTKKESSKRSIFEQNFGSEAPRDNLLNNLHKTNGNSNRNENIILSDLDSPTSGKDQISKTRHHTSNLNTKKESRKRSNFEQNFGNEVPHDNLLNNLHNTNENSNRNENIILSDLDSPTSGKDQMNKTREQRHSSSRLRPKKLFSLDGKENEGPSDEISKTQTTPHNKVINEFVQPSIIVEEYSNKSNNLEVNLKETDVDTLINSNNKIGNTKLGRNRSTRSGDVRTIRKSTRKKLEIVEKDHLVKTSKKKNIETLNDNIEQIEKIHKTRTSITTGSQKNNTNTIVKKHVIHNKKSFSQELPEVRKNKTVKQKSKKERNEKENINPKMEKSERVNKSTSTSRIKNKYAKVLHDLLQQRENAGQYYTNTSTISTINEDQTSGSCRPSRTRKQTKAFSLETLIITEKEFLSYCGMRLKGSTHSNRSKKSVVNPSDHLQKSQFKMPVAPPPTSKKKSRKKNSENLIQSNLPDSGNFTMIGTSSRSTADNNIEVLQDNMQANLGLENDIFLPPITEENNEVITDFKNNDNTLQNTSTARYNLRNKSSEMHQVLSQSKNNSQKKMSDDNAEQTMVDTNRNKMKNNAKKGKLLQKAKTDHLNAIDGNSTTFQTHDNCNIDEITHNVNETPRELRSRRKSIRNTEKRQLNDVSIEEKHKGIGHEIKILRTTICEKIIDKEDSTNQSFTTLPTSENYYELNDVCYVINNRAVKAAWCQKKPELTPVIGQQGLYVGYSESNRNLGFCTCSTGLMQIDPNCFKKQCYFKTSHAFYFVIGGEAVVTLGQRKMHVHIGESFFIPLGQDYSITNPSDTEKLLLSFTNIKAPKLHT